MSDSSSLAAALARQSLMADPTSAEAVNVLALQAQMRNETEEARALFEYSLQLSRRELPARLWAIEEAVTRGDIGTALYNYDLALRTSSRATELLLPNLIAALEEPLVREAIYPILAKQPPWGTKFLVEAAVNSSNPLSVLAFFTEPLAKSLPIPPETSAYLVNNLASKGEWDAAWEYYTASNIDVSRTSSRDPDFSADLDVRTVFDWQTTLERGFVAEIVPALDRQLLEFELRPGQRGMIVQQRQVLPQGRYRLSSASEDLDSEDFEEIYWALDCDDGAELARIALLSEAEANANFNGVFEVPANCPHQNLRLMAVAASAPPGPAGRILRVLIEPF
ncbi:tetratricopeptide repeat protein [Qipengyuania sp. DGS5-3]|uniref:tetratricopeptide repeat protein n=1 Tax=Qipengyuania sp. DGS5-3 TaxID=3349632 RepID=UPI0036D3BD73